MVGITTHCITPSALLTTLTCAINTYTGRSCCITPSAHLTTPTRAITGYTGRSRWEHTPLLGIRFLSRGDAQLGKIIFYYWYVEESTANVGQGSRMGQGERKENNLLTSGSKHS